LVLSVHFANACFNRSDWVACGKTWIDVPKPIRQLCRNDFKIPDALASEILPGDTLSIDKFLDFSLPLVSSGILEAPDLSTYFSKYAADTPDSSMILRIHHLHLPPAKIIHRLAHDGLQAWMDGFTSVRYAHLSGEGIVGMLGRTLT
jgi:hypothetical protein